LSRFIPGTEDVFPLDTRPAKPGLDLRAKKLTVGTISSADLIKLTYEGEDYGNRETETEKNR
jgi:hypothetical protein